jgi:hypothetical protein
MSTVDEGRFGKAISCPRSEDLMSLMNSEFIRSHLAGCEFCAAELNFLSAYPSTALHYEPVAMPAHLRVLAESLLWGRSGDLEEDPT